MGRTDATAYVQAEAHPCGAASAVGRVGPRQWLEQGQHAVLWDRISLVVELPP